MKKGGKSKMILIGVLCVLMGIVVYLKIPYSPVKKEYWETVERLTDEYKLSTKKITEEDLKVLPEVLQMYFIKNGYLGIESASAVIFNFKGADFSLGIGKPDIKIDYTVHDFVKMPSRVALINSKMYGIPFQGINLPTKFQGVWNYSDGDLIYFNSNGMKISFQ